MNLCKKLCTRAKKYVNKLYNDHAKVKKELEEKRVNLEYREKKANIEYDKLKESFNKKHNELKASYEKEKEANEQELEEAIKETEKELKGWVDKVDEMIEDKIADLTLKNTLTFDCVCGKKDIPCFIDLTKENAFRCDQCNSVYSINAKFSPVIIGRASSEEEFAKIVENRMQEEADERL